MVDEDGNFGEWRRLLVRELERLSDGQKEMNEKLSEMKAEIEVLKFKSGLWGAIAGIVTTSVFLASVYLRSPG